jgi:hypothetical protein
MAFNPIPIIALAVGATLLFTRKDDSKEPTILPKPKPGPTPEPEPEPDAREIVPGAVETPFGDLAIEMRPVQGGYQLWFWDMRNREWATIETGGQAAVFDTPEEAADTAADLLEANLANFDILVTADFQVVEDGNSPMTFAPNKPGDTALVTNIDTEGQYRARLASGDYKDFVAVAAFTMGPQGPTHLVVASQNGARPADALSVDFTPKGAADNVRLPLVVM